MTPGTTLLMMMPVTTLVGRSICRKKASIRTPYSSAVRLGSVVSRQEE